MAIIPLTVDGRPSQMFVLHLVGCLAWSPVAGADSPPDEAVANDAGNSTVDPPDRFGGSKTIAGFGLPAPDEIGPYCMSQLVIEGDIVEVELVDAFSVRATVVVERVLKGTAPATVYYQHPIGWDGGLDQLIVGDHAIVVGEYDPERGYI